MKLGFFTMPMHPIGKDWQQSLREDREAFILADELGFVEGYVGEHATDPEENITSSALFLATLVDATRRMKLGTGTINMPNHHPAAVAGNIAMLDHLLGGRFILGISPGALPSDAEIFGNMDMARPAMFLEAINQLLEIWSSKPPYNIKGQFWNITTERTHIAETGMGTVPQPLQRPHPPIVVTAVAPFSQGITEAAARGWTRSPPTSCCRNGSRATGASMWKAASAPTVWPTPATGASPRPCSWPRTTPPPNAMPPAPTAPITITTGRCSTSSRSAGRWACSSPIPRCRTTQ